MKVASFFSGIGAFEKALERIGAEYELACFCEIDKYASKSYAAIHGVSEGMNLGDITKVDEKQLPKDIDLLTYGFPCQDISICGAQKGLFNADGTQTRSGLFFEALRIIEETRPRVAIAENVKNLTSKKFAGQFKLVLESLEAAGYNNYWQVLNAKDFGIPQNRERVFIVSIRKDIDNGTFEFPTGFPLELMVMDVLEREVDRRFYLSDEQIHKLKMASNEALIYDVSMLGFENCAREYNDIMPTITAREHKEPRLVNQGKLEDEHKDDDKMRIRKLTPKECYRLMGFDDADFEKAASVNSNTQLYKQAGNSIVVPVVENILSELLKSNML